MIKGGQGKQHAPLALRSSSDEKATKGSKGSKGNTPSPIRRLAGARAQGSGAAFETWLARFIFTPMVARGVLARFDKLDPPSRPRWDVGRQRVVMVPLGVGGGDWLLLAPGGSYIACESKTTADDRFYRAEIEPHQAQHLDQAVNAGGAAYLALQFRTGGSATAYLMPWAAVPWQIARSAPSLTAEDCAPWPLRSWIDGAKVIQTSMRAATPSGMTPNPNKEAKQP